MVAERLLSGVIVGIQRVEQVPVLRGAAIPRPCLLCKGIAEKLDTALK